MCYMNLTCLHTHMYIYVNMSRCMEGKQPNTNRYICMYNMYVSRCLSGYLSLFLSLSLFLCICIYIYGLHAERERNI